MERNYLDKMVREESLASALRCTSSRCLSENLPWVQYFLIPGNESSPWETPIIYVLHAGEMTVMLPRQRPEDVTKIISIPDYTSALPWRNEKEQAQVVRMFLWSSHGRCRVLCAGILCSLCQVFLLFAGALMIGENASHVSIRNFSFSSQTVVLVKRPMKCRAESRGSQGQPRLSVTPAAQFVCDKMDWLAEILPLP
jgi:hypothetical protein